MRVYLLLWILLFIIVPGSPTIKCGHHQFYCPNYGRCYYKHEWCGQGCSGNIQDYFSCDDNNCNIPTNGRCDGFPSCPDGSDELDCECEEVLELMGFINYTMIAGKKRISKCWKIEVPSNKFLSLELKELDLKDQDKFIEVSSEKSSSSPQTITILPKSLLYQEFDTFDDTEVRFKSTSRARVHSQVVLDSFAISFVVADVLCKRSDSFKCSVNSCILPEKQCDGINDCSNGADERKCEKGVFKVPGVNETRSRTLDWLKKQRNAAWGWRENTHRAVVALYLSHGANFNGTNQDEDLTAKQLELQLTTAILRNDTDNISTTQLSMYINALLVICHDPRNFYGFDLVEILKNQLQSSSHVHHPLSYLALCNAKEALTNESISKVLAILESPSEYSYLADVQSVALITLSCLKDNPEFSYLEADIENATERFKKQQLPDGSFGNIYTTALIVQALLSSGAEEDKDWNLKEAVEFFQSKQNQDGSFGDFLATYLILPILNGKSLLDVAKINCTQKLRMPRDGDSVSDIKLKLGPKISINYYLYIGDEKEQIHPIFLQTPSNITALELMRLAADADAKYSFKSQNIGSKPYVYEVYGIANDPEDGKFWFLYTGHNETLLTVTSKSPDEIILLDKDKIVMWYKSADHY